MTRGEASLIALLLREKAEVRFDGAVFKGKSKLAVIKPFRKKNNSLVPKMVVDSCISNLYIIPTYKEQGMYKLSLHGIQEYEKCLPIQQKARPQRKFTKIDPIVDTGFIDE